MVEYVNFRNENVGSYDHKVIYSKVKSNIWSTLYRKCRKNCFFCVRPNKYCCGEYYRVWNSLKVQVVSNFPIYVRPYNYVML